MKQKKLCTFVLYVAVGKLLEWWLASVLLSNSVFPSVSHKIPFHKGKHFGKIPSDFSFSVIKLLPIASAPKMRKHFQISQVLQSYKSHFYAHSI